MIRPESFSRSSLYIPSPRFSRIMSLSLALSLLPSELQNTISPGKNVGIGVAFVGCVFCRRCVCILIMSSWLKSRVSPVTMSRDVHSSTAASVDHRGFEFR